MPKQTVLVVDDEEAVRRFVTSALTAAGYFALAASSADEARPLLAPPRPPADLLLIDARLALRCGRPVATDLVAEGSVGRVLYTSGRSHQGLVRIGLVPAGAIFLQKPFRLLELLRVVKEILGG